jgi:hypothetical protein
VKTTQPYTMALPKGRTNNPHGRPAGSPNIVTREIRPIIRDFVQGEIENLDKIVKSLEPRDRAALLVKLLDYIIPKADSSVEKLGSIHNQNQSESSEHLREYYKRIRGETDEQLQAREEELTKMLEEVNAMKELYWQYKNLTNTSQDKVKSILLNGPKSKEVYHLLTSPMTSQSDIPNE